jgi:hypothetical protein
VGIYLWRRKRGNKRQGPGATVNTQYIRYVVAPHA